MSLLSVVSNDRMTAEAIPRRFPRSSPWPTSMALFQRSTTAANRSQVLAANGAATVVAVPAGTMLGGPLVSALGARGALLFCAVAIITFGVLAAGFTVSRRHAPAIDDSAHAEGVTVPLL